MAIISPNEVSLTTNHLHCCVTATNMVVSSASGFIYKYRDHLFLITNWHNVTGKDPASGNFLPGVGCIPDMITTMFRQKENPGNCAREHLPLYADEQLLEPLWLEHPIHRKTVDVVALPIDDSIAAKYKFFPINEIKFDNEFPAEVADDAFVIGYPFFELTYLQLPIWKKASIASEPDVNIEQLPKLLIDTATRHGLSGSPVIMQRTGIHGIKDGKVSPESIIGRIRTFLGVYSGRIGTDELKAQLGIVWKAQVIEEILAGGVRGEV